MENPLKNTDEFPYTLNTGRGTVGQWHTQTRTREIRNVKEVTLKEAYALVNTKFCEELDLQNNDMIRVDSINGLQTSR